jgi:hypothetical protein
MKNCLPVAAPALVLTSVSYGERATIRTKPIGGFGKVVLDIGDQSSPPGSLNH